MWDYINPDKCAYFSVYGKYIYGGQDNMLLGLKEKKREQGKTEDIRRAMEQWQEAERYFKSVSDTDLVDYAVFEMEAARRKYMLLLKRYAEERKYRE